MKPSLALAPAPRRHVGAVGIGAGYYLRTRLELTERAEATLEREQALEELAEDLRRELEALRETRESPQPAGGGGGEVPNPRQKRLSRAYRGPGGVALSGSNASADTRLMLLRTMRVFLEKGKPVVRRGRKA